VYVSVPVNEASATTARLSVYRTLVERQPAMVEHGKDMWLGSRQQVDKIDKHEVPIMLSSVTTVDTARDLGVIMGHHLTMSAHVSPGCASYVKSCDRCRLMLPRQ